jgi:transcriptional regulator GlxA family with amidase domain
VTAQAPLPPGAPALQEQEQEAILQALVEALLAALEAPYPIDSPFVGQLLRALQTHVLAQVGATYLGRLVPQQRSLHYRLALSVVLLQCDMPLVDIAAACGFKDVRHFSRSFRRVMGIPPR